MTLRMSEQEYQVLVKRREAWNTGQGKRSVGRKAKAGPFHVPPPKIENGALYVSLPLRLVNGANESGEHWSHRRKRAKAHRDIAAQFLPHQFLPPLPVTVTITRIGPKLMDDDGNQISAKHLRDGIADRYYLDDASDQIQWVYAQRKGDYGVELEIRPR